MKEIKLTKGYIALVDDEDFEYLSKHSWHSVIYNKKKNKQHIYAQTTIRAKDLKKNYKMHRYILNLIDTKLDIDHINGNTLDNRRCNLRICTRSQNNMNAIKRNHKNSCAPISKYKGVRYSFIYKTNGKKYIRNKPWVAGATFNNKPKYLGYFKTEIEAAQAYDEFVLLNYGDFALINFKGDKNV